MGYSIDGVAVTRAEFERLVASLLPEKKHWSCDDMSDGGVVSYELADRDGNVYSVREVSSSMYGDERSVERRGRGL